MVMGLIDGCVAMSGGFEDEIKDSQVFVGVTRAETTPTTSDGFGPVQSGFIQLKDHLTKSFKATISDRGYGRVLFNISRDTGPSLHSEQVFYLLIDVFEYQGWAKPMRYLRGLILNSTRQKSGQYSRCGVVSVRDWLEKVELGMEGRFEEFLTNLQLPLDEEDFESMWGPAINSERASTDIE